MLLYPDLTPNGHTVMEIPIKIQKDPLVNIPVMNEPLRSDPTTDAAISLNFFLEPFSSNMSDYPAGVTRQYTQPTRTPIMKASLYVLIFRD